VVVDERPSRRAGIAAGGSVTASRESERAVAAWTTRVAGWRSPRLRIAGGVPPGWKAELAAIK